MVKRRRTSISRYMPLWNAAKLGFNAGRRVKQAYNSYKSLTDTKGRKLRTGAPLTAQHDVRVTYRKRRMPKRKKRAYVRSVKRFRSMSMRSTPSRIFQYVDVKEYTSGINTSRYFGCFMGLYNHSTYDNSLKKAADNITLGSAANEKMRAGGFRLDHQGLRIVVRNNDSTPIDLDVYQVVCIKDIPPDVWPSGNNIESMHATLKNMMRQAQGMDLEVTTAGTGISTIQQNAGTSSTTQVVGDSLWNNPPFLRYFKIIKQFKIQLPSGNSTEFQMRSTKNKYIRYSELQNNAFGQISAKAYVTQGYIFNINGRASIVSGVPSFDDVSCIVEQYVRYNIKAVDGNSPTLVYDAA